MTTMIADTPRSTTRLGVGLDADRRRSPNADAWKAAIGTKPIAARLALLPDSKPRWSRIGLSAVAQLGLLIFCVLIPLLYPDQLKTALNYRNVEIATPLTEIPVAPPPPPPRPSRAPRPRRLAFGLLAGGLQGSLDLFRVCVVKTQALRIGGHFRDILAEFLG